MVNCKTHLSGATSYGFRSGVVEYSFLLNMKPRHLVIGSTPLGTIQCFNLQGSGAFGPLNFKLGLYIGKFGTYCQLHGLMSYKNEILSYKLLHVLHFNIQRQ